MVRVFLSFFSGVSDVNNINAIPCFYETFIQGLNKNGNEVFAFVSKTFGKDFENIPRDLLLEIKNFQPEIVILFNNAFYDISQEVDCPIFIYEVDSPLYYSNKKQLKQNVDRYKFIVVQEESVKILKNEFKVSDKNILIAPFFTEIKNEDIGIKQNISFIGTKFISSLNRTPYSLFMENHPNEQEKNIYKMLIQEIEKEPFLSKEELFKKYDVKSDLINKYFNPSDIIFYLSDFNRIKTLSAVADFGIKIYGTSNWVSDNYNEPLLVLNYDKTPIYSIKDNQNVYNSSKIGININHLQAKQGFSWRVCDIMASGACLVSEYKSDLVKYFKDIYLPIFKTPDEARILCQKLLKDEILRKEIVFASNDIINKKFRFKNIKELIEDYFSIKLQGEKSSLRFYVEKPVIKSQSQKNIKLKYKIYLKFYTKLRKKLERKGLI